MQQQVVAQTGLGNPRVRTAFERQWELQRQQGLATRQSVYDAVARSTEPVAAIEVAKSLNRSVSSLHTVLAELVANGLLSVRVETIEERGVRAGRNTAPGSRSQLYWCGDTVPPRTQRTVLDGFTWEPDRGGPKRPRRSGRTVTQANADLIDRYRSDASYRNLINDEIITVLRRSDANLGELQRLAHRSSYTIREAVDTLVRSGIVEYCRKPAIRGTKLRMVVQPYEPQVEAAAHPTCLDGVRASDAPVAPVAVAPAPQVSTLATALAAAIEDAVTARTADVIARAELAEAQLAELRRVLGVQ